MDIGRQLSGERGATLVEYAVLLAVGVLVMVPVINWLQEESGTYLLETGDDIGRGRSAPATPFVASAPASPIWVEDTPTYGPNLVSNGSFESPIVPNEGWAPVSAPPWASSDTSVEIWDSGHNGVSSYSGAQYSELNYNGLTTYSQTVSVSSGSTYRWSIAHRAIATTSEQAELVIDGSVVAQLQSPLSWTEYQGVFVASSSSVLLEIRSVSPNSGSGNLIDDVRIQEITS